METNQITAAVQQEETKKNKANWMSYTHTFQEPFEYMGKKYEELTFDWGKLTGKDSLAIENEMAQMGIALVNPAFSSEYMVRMAAVACNEAIGSDAFDDMALPDFLKIRRKAKDFLLRAEQ